MRQLSSYKVVVFLMLVTAVSSAARDRQTSLSSFLGLAPHERVQDWKRQARPGGEYGDSEWRQKTAGLIAYGTDAVPELAAIVRQDKSFYQIEVVKVLCEMDRYVPVMETPLTGVDGTIRSDVLGIEGYADPFRKVDGHRIGKDGYETVKWAAEQEENRNLRVIARSYSGMLREEIDALPLAQKVDAWKTEAKETRAGFDAGRPEHYYLFHELSRSLIEKDRSHAVVPLTELLNRDKNGFVRGAVVSLLENIDLCASAFGGRRRGSKRSRPLKWRSNAAISNRFILEVTSGKEVGTISPTNC